MPPLECPIETWEKKAKLPVFVRAAASAGLDALKKSRLMPKISLLLVPSCSVCPMFVLSVPVKVTVPDAALAVRGHAGNMDSIIAMVNKMLRSLRFFIHFPP